MKYIGNILTNGKEKYNELLNVTNKKEELLPNIPTLVIGFDFTKSNYNKVNVIDRCLEKDIYWTFGNRERRDRYESDLKWFIDMCVETFVKKLKYKYLNVLKEDNETIKNVIKSIFSNDSFAFISFGMVYVYNKCNDNVIGISIRDIEYGGGDVKKFISKIYRKTTVVTVDDSISYETKNILYKNAHIIPYVFSE